MPIFRVSHHMKYGPVYLISSAAQEWKRHF